MNGNTLTQRINAELDSFGIPKGSGWDTVSRINELGKQRDEARFNVERLQNWNNSQAEISKNERSGRYRPEPSRLEIAAMLAAAWTSNPAHDESSVDAKWWLQQADALIAETKEVAK
jgi:hypothetical protein